MNNYFGNNVKKFREKMGYSQTQLANKIINEMSKYNTNFNYSNKTISKWENGDGMPSLEIIILLSNLFNVSIDELVKSEKPKSTLSNVENECVYTNCLLSIDSLIGIKDEYNHDKYQDYDRNAHLLSTICKCIYDYNFISKKFIARKLVGLHPIAPQPYNREVIDFYCFNEGEYYFGKKLKSLSNYYKQKFEVEYPIRTYTDEERSKITIAFSDIEDALTYGEKEEDKDTEIVYEETFLSFKNNHTQEEFSNFCNLSIEQLNELVKKHKQTIIENYQSLKKDNSISNFTIETKYDDSKQYLAYFADMELNLSDKDIANLILLREKTPFMLTLFLHKSFCQDEFGKKLAKEKGLDNIELDCL